MVQGKNETLAMKVETDSKSGFCFGVENAVRIAEKALAEGETVYSLGSIVHNDQEVERLSALGLRTIDKKQYSDLKSARVLIRAHGEPPGTYQTGSDNNIDIIEATCPIVKKLQDRIKNAWLRSRDSGGQVVIYGKKGHAEVVGLLGQIDNSGILASSSEDLSYIDFTKPVELFSQTTMSVDGYEALAQNIRLAMEAAGTDPKNLLRVHRTICGQVSNREPHLRDFAGKHEVIIFVSGKDSSNGKHLYEVCKSINPDTYFISSPAELDPSWFKGRSSAGICGATSTPRWLIEKTKEAIEAL